MKILIAILSSLTGGLWSVLSKKSVEANRSGPAISLWMGYQIVFVVALVALIFGWIRNPLEIFSQNSWVLLVFIVYASGYFLIFPFEQKALILEKLSRLQPYGNVGKIIGIIGGFFLLGERQIITLIVALLAFGLCVYHAGGGKISKISKGILFYLGGQVIRGIGLLLTGFLLTSGALMDEPFSGLELAGTECAYALGILTIYLLATKQFPRMKDSPAAFYKYRYGGCLIGDISWLTGLFLIANLGIIMSSILSLITIASTLIIGYFWLNDKPEKRDIIFAVIIVVLISIGYAFKNVTL